MLSISVNKENTQLKSHQNETLFFYSCCYMFMLYKLF